MITEFEPRIWMHFLRTIAEKDEKVAYENTQSNVKTKFPEIQARPILKAPPILEMPHNILQNFSKKEAPQKWKYAQEHEK